MYLPGLSRRAAQRCAPDATTGFRIFLFLTLITSICFPQVLAQTNQPTPDDEVLRITVDLLLFPARIRDKSGNRPNGLTERDLSLEDPDGVIGGLYFSAGVDRVAFVFALDQSGSLRDLIKQQRDAAIGLHERFGAKSSIAVLHFAETPTIAAPFAHNPSPARDAFDLSARRNQRTAIFDAAAKAVELFDMMPRARTERRIVILISDGLDNASRRKASAVIDAARDKQVSFYVIHLRQYEVRDGRVVQRRPSKGFTDLGPRTGGGYFYPDGGAFDARETLDLRPIFELIESDLRSQHMVGFYLNEKANDGRRHSFSLSLPKGFEYQVGRRGYERTQKFFVERPREALKGRS